MTIFKRGKNINGRTRFTILNIKGMYAKRKLKSRGYSIERGDTFTAYHLGRRTIYIEFKKNARKVSKTFVDTK